MCKIIWIFVKIVRRKGKNMSKEPTSTSKSETEEISKSWEDLHQPSTVDSNGNYISNNSMIRNSDTTLSVDQEKKINICESEFCVTSIFVNNNISTNLEVISTNTEISSVNPEMISTNPEIISAYPELSKNKKHIVKDNTKLANPTLTSHTITPLHSKEKSKITVLQQSQVVDLMEKKSEDSISKSDTSFDEADLNRHSIIPIRTYSKKINSLKHTTINIQSDQILDKPIYIDRFVNTYNRKRKINYSPKIINQNKAAKLSQTVVDTCNFQNNNLPKNNADETYSSNISTSSTVDNLFCENTQQHLNSAINYSECVSLERDDEDLITIPSETPPYKETPDILSVHDSEQNCSSNDENHEGQSIIDSKAESSPNNVSDGIDGLRITDLNYLWAELHRVFDNHKESCPCQLKDIKFTRAFDRGMRTLIYLICEKCQYRNSIWTNPEKPNDRMPLHDSLVLGTLTAGVGYENMRICFCSSIYSCHV